MNELEDRIFNGEFGFGFDLSQLQQHTDDAHTKSEDKVNFEIMIECLD